MRMRLSREEEGGGDGKEFREAPLPLETVLGS